MENYLKGNDAEGRQPSGRLYRSFSVQARASAPKSAADESRVEGVGHIEPAALAPVVPDQPINMRGAAGKHHLGRPVVGCYIEIVGAGQALGIVPLLVGL